jgi:hypothetical protein
MCGCGGGGGGCRGVRRGEKSFAPTTFGFDGACRLGCIGDNDDAVYVIGHDNKGIQFNKREMVRNVLPTTPGDFASLVQPHFFIDNLAEKAFPIAGANRHEIRPWLGIIMSLQADGMAIVSAQVDFPQWSSTMD